MVLPFTSGGLQEVSWPSRVCEMPMASINVSSINVSWKRLKSAWTSGCILVFPQEAFEALHTECVNAGYST